MNHFGESFINKGKTSNFKVVKPSEGFIRTNTVFMKVKVL